MKFKIKFVGILSHIPRKNKKSLKKSLLLIASELWTCSTLPKAKRIEWVNGMLDDVIAMAIDCAIGRKESERASAESFKRLKAEFDAARAAGKVYD
jgi:hypothetical protein